MPTKNELRMLQALPLELKVMRTKQRIREWVNYYGVDGVYVSFSGGKDSTVLLHIARELYPDIEAVFVNTGLEYPEIQKFVKTFDNVKTVYPKMRFDEVIRKYGYPVISKEVSKCIYAWRKNPSGWIADRWDCNGKHTKKFGAKFCLSKWVPIRDSNIPVSHLCCAIMKKRPAKNFEKETGKKAILGILAKESALRETEWLKSGCNSFNGERPTSNPMAFWTEQDVLQYIKENNLPIASIYGEIVNKDKDGYYYENSLCSCGHLTTMGAKRTGCIFCMFGAHCPDDNRFVSLKQTHPRQYEYCMGGGAYDENGVWKPTKNGLGMKHVIDEVNKIYGKDFIKY